MNVVSESDSMGANSLTPNCPNDSGNAICNNLTNTFPIYQVAADRLMQQNPGLNITVNDISNLMGKIYPPRLSLFLSFLFSIYRVFPNIRTNVPRLQRRVQWS